MKRPIKYRRHQIRREHGRYYVYDGSRFVNSADDLATACMWVDLVTGGMG